MAATSQIKEKFEDYDGFVEKFKPKKTTDDCYTPPEVYNAVVEWVNDNVMPLDGVKILRPFYPGGDYEHADYPEGSVVIDNPPFSIFAKICRFYNDRGIKFFLFAPALTCNSSDPRNTIIIANASVVYENGADVPTSFMTNMLSGDPRVVVAGDLNKKIKSAQDATRVPKSKRKIIYPNHVVTPAILGHLAVRGIKLAFPARSVHFIRKLDNYKKGLFGAAFLLSERAAAERAAAERAAAERAALSERELEIIKGLSRYD